MLPAALASSPATAHVGGYTATMSDLSQRVAQRLPIFLVAVVAMSYLLLMVLFRSLVVPLKAAVLNLLSVAASYGVLVMVFQWGWAASLIGLESTVPIISFIPLFMFAILFGLSMDYEVFLLSRVREEYLRTGDNGYAVVRGIAVTARTISCGAAIMVSVFVGFRVRRRPRPQDARPRPRDRGVPRRDPGAPRAGPRDDETARGRQLVAPGMAGPAAAEAGPGRS